MRPIPTISVLLVLLTPLLQSVARPASAAEAAKPWRIVYDHCLKLSNEGDYRGALPECERAYAMNPDPGILAYIAQIHTALLHPVQARDALKLYLQSDKLSEDDRKTAKTQVLYLETLISTLLVTTRLEGAEIRIDEQVMDPSVLARGVQLPAGAHRVTLQSKGTTFSRFIVLRAGERTEIELPGSGTILLSCAIPQVRFFIDDQEVSADQAARGIPQAAGSHRVTFKAGSPPWPEQAVQVSPDERITVVCTPPRPAQPSVASSTMNPRGYWVTGVGLSLGVAALATAIYNGHQYDKWQAANDSLRDDRLPFEQSKQIAQENNQLMQSIQSTRAVAVGLGIASGLVTAGGVALLFTDSRKPARNGSSSWLRDVATGFTVNGGSRSGEIAWRGAW